MFAAVLSCLTELPVLSFSLLMCGFIYVFISLFCLRFLPSLEICAHKKLEYKTKTLFLSISNEVIIVSEG